MNSDLFNSIGIGNVDPGYYILGMAGLLLIMLILLIVQINKTSKLQKKYAKFMRGKEVKSLEKEIGQMFEDNARIRELGEKNKKDIRVIYHTLESTFQKAGLVKYDAFPQMGGKLSFSLALLNEKDNGFIINSVHSTEGSYCYTKEVKQGISDVDLGKEEKEALDMALNNNK